MKNYLAEFRRKEVILNLLLVVCLSFSLVSCTKKRPTKLTDEQKRDLVDLQYIQSNDSFTVKANLLVPKKESTNGIVYSSVDLKSVPSFYKKAFENLLLEGGKTEYKIKMKLREDKKIIAYKVVPESEGTELSIFERNVAEKEGSSLLVPLFFYNVSFISSTVHKDDRGQDTIHYELFETKLNSAQYVRIDFNRDTKNLVKDQFEEDDALVLRKKDITAQKIAIKLSEECENSQKTIRCPIVARVPALNEFDFLFKDLKISSTPGRNIEVFLDVDAISKKIILKKYINSEEEKALLTTNEKLQLKPDSISGGIYYELVSHDAVIADFKKALNSENFPDFGLNTVENYNTGLYVVISPDAEKRSFFENRVDLESANSIKDYTAEVIASCIDKDLVLLERGMNEDGKTEKEEHCRIHFVEGTILPKEVAKIGDQLFLPKKYIPEGKFKILIKFLEGEISISRVISKDTVDGLPREMKLSLTPQDDNEFLFELFRQSVTYFKKQYIQDNRGRILDNYHLERITDPEKAEFFEISNAKDRKMISLVERDVHLIEKSRVNVKDLFLFVPSTQDVPSVAATMLAGHMQGDPELVRFKISENSIEVYRVNDKIYMDNGKDPYETLQHEDSKKNDRIILTIPIRHVDYKKGLNTFGKIGIQEQEDNTLNWEKRRFIIPKYTDIHAWNFNKPEEGYFGISSECGHLINTHLDFLDFFEQNSDSAYIQVKKNYQLTNSYCLDFSGYEDMYEMENKSNVANFYLNYAYAFKKLDTLRSKDYKPVEYPIEDQRRFGFFAVKHEILDPVTLDPDKKQDKYLLKRWNPHRDRGVVSLSLSENFKKPENKVFVDATVKSLEIINDGLQRAGVNFKVELSHTMGKNEKGEDIPIYDYEKHPGRLDKNTVVLIDEQLGEASLLGYCPVVEDPLSGEIVKSHISMYGSTMKKIARKIYSEIAFLENNRMINDKIAGSDSSAKSAEGGNDNNQNDVNKKNKSESVIIKEYLENKRYLVDSYLNKDGADVSNQIDSFLAQIKNSDIDLLTRNLFETNDTSFKKFATKQFKLDDNADRKNEFLFFEKRMKLKEALSEKAYTVDELNIVGLDIGELGQSDPQLIFKTDEFNKETIEKVQIGDRKNVLLMKDWDRLSKEMQKKITNHISKHLYITTFIHEFGHGLGLRHNFMSKFDEKNFYNKNDSSDDYAKLVLPTTIPRYTSVMDYAITFREELPVFGKYDIAALKFGYQRVIDIVDPNETDKFEQVSLNNDTLSTYLKKNRDIKAREYSYCTDEDKAHDPLFCQPHIAGKDLYELAEFFKQRYKVTTEFYSHNSYASHIYDGFFSQLNYFYTLFGHVMKLKQISWLDFTKVFMTNYVCSHSEDNRRNKFLCEQFTAIENKDVVTDVSRFLGTELGMTDHYCLIKKHKANEVISNTYLNDNFVKKNREITNDSLREEKISKVPLKMIFDLYVDLNKDDKSSSQEVDVIHFPTTCFDSRVQSALKNMDIEKALRRSKAANRIKEGGEELKKQEGKLKETEEKNEVIAENSKLKKTIIGEYGRQMSDYQLNYSDGAQRNEISVRGAWMNKIVIAYLSAIPFSTSLYHMGTDISRIISVGEMYNSVFLNDVLDKIILGKKLVSPLFTAGRIKDPQRDYFAANLDYDPIIIHFNNSYISRYLGFYDDHIDVNREVVHLIHNIYSSFIYTSKENTDVLREKKLALEYMVDDQYGGAIRPQFDDVIVYRDLIFNDKGEKKSTGKSYYAGEYNTYAQILLKSGLFVQDAIESRQNLLNGNFDIGKINKERNYRLAWGIKNKYSSLKNIDDLFLTTHICQTTEIKKLFETISSLGQREKNDARFNKILKIFSDALLKKSVNDSIAFDGNLQYEWRTMYDLVLNNGKCEGYDYELVSNILMMTYTMFSPLKDILSDIDYAHALELQGSRSHLTFLNKDILESYYKVLIGNGDIYNKNFEDKNNSFANPEYDKYRSLMNRVLEILKEKSASEDKSNQYIADFKNLDTDEKKLKEVNMQAEKWFETFYFLLRESIIPVKKETMEDFLQKSPLALEEYRSNEKKRNELIKEIRKGIEEARLKIVKGVIADCAKIKECSEKEEFTELNELINKNSSMVALLDDSENKNVGEKLTGSVQIWRNKRQLEVKKITEELLKNPTLKARLDNEIEIMRAKRNDPIGKGHLLKLRKLKRALVAPVGPSETLKTDSDKQSKVQEEMFNVLGLHEFTKEQSSVTSFAHISRDIEMLIDFNHIKDRFIGSGLFGVTKTRDQELSLDDFKYFKENFETFRKAYDKHKLDNGFRIDEGRLKYLVPVSINAQ